MRKGILIKGAGAQTLEVVGKEPSVQTDVTANDSDKTFTVPTGKIWEVLGIYVKLVSDATVGNRKVKILLTKADDSVIWDSVDAFDQAASLTRVYLGIPGGALKDNAIRGQGELPLPNPCQLPAGYKIRVYDSAAIAATTDDMDVQVLVNELVKTL